MSAIDELNKKLDKVVEDFKSSLTPLTKTIETVKETSDKLSTGIGALNQKVLDLSNDVGNLEDLVKSNKDLSDKVTELFRVGGTLEKMPSNIVTILTKPDGDLNNLIGKYFSELMEDGASVKAMSISFNSMAPIEDHQILG